MKTIILLTITWCVGMRVYGQHPMTSDTVRVYAAKTGGVTYKSYLNAWFYHQHKHIHKWDPKAFNKQDSLVLFDTLPHVFKVYDKYTHLQFTGRNGGMEKELIGEVIYYYKNGNVQRNEYYNHRYSKDTCQCSYILNDAPGPEGTWTYYRENGSVKKTVEYYIKVYSCVPDRYTRLKKITSYSKILSTLMLLPFLLPAQSIYSGQNWTFKISRDSSVIFVRYTLNSGYEEYSGKIRQLNDSLYKVQANMVFSQAYCRAIGDSLMYVSIDSLLANAIDTIHIEYANKERRSFSAKGQSTIIIPMDKKLYNKGQANHFFYITVGHINPITHREVKARYDKRDEYCMEIYTEPGISFNVVIKNNKLRKTGKGRISNFVLTNNPD